MPITTLDHPLVQQRIGQLRARPTNPLFRLYTQDLCRFLTYEASRDFPLESHEVEGFAGPVQAKRLQGKAPTAVPVLRAGLGMLPGFLDIFPDAPVSMAGLRRDEETLQPVTYYENFVTDVAERTAFVLDPMLATGGSFVATLNLLKQARCQRIIGLFLVAAPEGVHHALQEHPDVHIYTCSLDQKLNQKGYIIPGLGDAGDLLFGTL